jgi:hypothetical protein
MEKRKPALVRTTPRTTGVRSWSWTRRKALKDGKSRRKRLRSNRFKNRNDLVPRSEDSPSIRRDKLFGDAELYSLARGIAEELADDEDERGFPRWNEQGKLVSSVELDETLENHDLIYIKELIKKNVASALKQTRAQAQKQGVGCSWASIMRALADIERAQNPPKK